MGVTNIKHIHILTLALMCCLSSGAFAQNGIDSVREKFDSYRSSVLQEKIYAHTDKETYFAGEILWLKLYYVDASFHHPLNVSKVAYVELIDQDNQSLLQGKIELTNGSGKGSFFVKASIPSGNYILRAYTNWMKNFSSDYFFQKEITIINPFQKLEGQRAAVSTSFEAQFFPEGGQLVNGLSNTVAIQVVNSSGSGIDFKGGILNDKNDTVASFRSLKFGIGSFHFTPAQGNNYRAVIVDYRGQKKIFNFLKAADAGYVLHAERNAENIAITISNNTGDNSPLFLFIHSRQRISFARQLSGQSQTQVIIPLKEFYDGISHITLLNSKKQPLCERLFFKRPENRLDISASTDQTSYNKRGKIKLTLSTGNDDKATSNLSISVARIDSLVSHEQKSIVDYLALGSDLKGVVESPEYYLSNDADVVNASDNLMLTHGWRRFSWQDVFNRRRQEKLFLPEYRGHIIQADVKDEKGTGGGNVVSYLSSSGKYIQLYISRSDSSGKVLFEMKDFTGPKKLIAQTNLKKDSLVRITLTNPFSNQFSSLKPQVLRLSPTAEGKILSASIYMQVQDIYYKDRIENFRVVRSDTIPFYGKVDETYFLDDYTRFPVMEEVMREYVSGVYVRKRKDGFHFLMLNRIKGDLLREDPLILLDGIPIFDVNTIMAYNPLQVKKIDLLTRKYFLGPMIFPGIVSYATYNGDMAGFELDRKTVVLDYEGLQLQREFYSPSYQASTTRQARLPDRRSLLYWNPEVIVNDEKREIEFYASDTPGAYRVVIEGITNDGLPGSSAFVISVK